MKRLNDIGEVCLYFHCHVAIIFNVKLKLNNVQSSIYRYCVIICIENACVLIYCTREKLAGGNFGEPYKVKAIYW